MAEFTIPGFNRRYVLVPMLVCIALVMAALLVTEVRRSEVMQTSMDIRQAQERMRILSELIYAVADAESGQRGYLLTHDSDYLKPYEEAVARIGVLLPELRNAYLQHREELPTVEQIVASINSKLEEMQATLQKAETGSAGAALQLIKSGEGLQWMSTVRTAIETVRSRERQLIYTDILHWEQQHHISRYISFVGALLNVLLLLVAGIYITRDIERRTAAANELDHLVAQRTSELAELSTHLQQVTEIEKSRLARELHDELGGLLVAIKMDLAQLMRHVDLNQPEVLTRWNRIQEGINAGVGLKRRIIEELRPTLLDNMGLVAALQWQAEQVCSQADIALQLSLPDNEPTLDTDISIAIFRVAQETLTNIAKHARATEVQVAMQVDDRELLLIIEDNGVGMPPGSMDRPGSHGLRGMRHRINSIGGSLHTVSGTPTGTRVVIRVPVEIARAIASLG